MAVDDTQFKSIHFPTMKNALLEHQKLLIYKFPPIGFACIIFTLVFMLDHKLTLSHTIWIFFAGYSVAAIWAWWLMEKTFVYAIFDDFGMNIYTINNLFDGEVSGVMYEPHGLKKSDKGFEFVVNNQVVLIRKEEWPEFSDIEASLQAMIYKYE